jgi:hypothetical protein
LQSVHNLSPFGRWQAGRNARGCLPMTRESVYCGDARAPSLPCSRSNRGVGRLLRSSPHSATGRSQTGPSETAVPQARQTSNPSAIYSIGRSPTARVRSSWPGERAYPSAVIIQVSAA